MIDGVTLGEGRKPAVRTNVIEMQNRHSRVANEVGALIRLRLLGPLQIEVEEKAIALASRKSRALIAYLALRRGEAVPRETLVGLLWGERGEEQARASLRQALSALRKALGEAAAAALVASNETVRLAVEDLWVDVEALERLGDSSTLEDLEAAVALYRGELLEGFALEEPAFDQWLAAERERTRLLFSRLLSSLVEKLERDQRIEDAIAQAARLVALDPLRESVHRTLMRLYLAQGRHDAALNQFEQCRRELSDQLDVRPEKETLDLVAEIKARRGQPRDAARSPEESPPEKDLRSQPDRPSIAVLPFANMSGDPEQEHFADGIAEDLITQLSRLRDLLVIARHSTFVFKGRSVTISQVASDLGVRFVLNGSVRRAGNRLRVTTQLIDAATGGHVWAERYDRELTDLFELQDEITKAITVALQVNLTEGEAARIAAEGTSNLQAWELCMQGHTAFNRFTKLDNFRARRFFEQAVVHDPGYWQALLGIANTHSVDARFRYTSDPAASLELAKAIVGRVEESGGETESLLAIKGFIALFEWRHGEALELHRRALELAPSNAYCAGTLGVTQVYVGDFQGSIESLKASLRLSPYGINWVTYYLVFAYLWLGDLEQARLHAASYLAREPQVPFAYVLSAIAEAASGQLDVARDHIYELLARHPEMTCEDFANAQFYRDPSRLEQLLVWLRDAGLPDGKDPKSAAS